MHDQKRIKGVIFDIGGVLAYDVWEHLLCDDPLSISAKFNIPADEMKEIGQKLWYRFDCRSGNPDKLEEEYWIEFLKQCKGYKKIESVHVSDLCGMTDPFIRPVNAEETDELLRWLTDRGVRLGICSNNNEFWFHRQFTKLGLYSFFSPNKITLSCRHGINKSDQRLFHIAVDALGLHATQCVFVDDRIGNVGRAIQCGMTGVLFPADDKRGAVYLRSLLAKIIL